MMRAADEDLDADGGTTLWGLLRMFCNGAECIVCIMPVVASSAHLHCRSQAESRHTRGCSSPDVSTVINMLPATGLRLVKLD